MRLHGVDGTYELFRAHFSKRPSEVDPRGHDVKAVVGVVSSILALLGDPDEGVTHVAIAFDNPIRSFRNDLFDGYKTERGVPPALLAQFDAVEDAMRAIGVVVWSMGVWEADDALATAAERYGGDVDQVRLLTPDKDLGQSLRGELVVQVDRMRKRVIDEAVLLATRGISPPSVPDYLALVGDAADGIPGVPKFGEKAASALLGAYGHIEAIPTNPAEWKVALRGARSLADALSTHRDEAFLYRKLATLVRTVPLAESLDDLRWRGIPRGPFAAWCDNIGASESLRARAAATAVHAVQTVKTPQTSEA